MMNLRIRDVGEVSIIDIDGNIDIDSAELVEVTGWLVKNGRLKILCNFENVDLVDYSGLSILSIAYKNVINHKGSMKFVNVSLPTLELFRLTHLDSVFEIYMDEENAIRSFEEISPVEKKPLRRRFQRLEISAEVEYKLKGITGARPFKEKIYNISGIGIFIYTHHIYPVKSQLLLRLFLPESQPLDVEGRIIWIADKQLQPHVYPGMGVQFVNLDTEKQKFIVDFVDKNITHRPQSLNENPS